MKIIQLLAGTIGIDILAGTKGTNKTTGWTMPSGDVATMPVEIRRYNMRTWAVYLGGELLCVTEYLKGGRAVQSCVEQLQEALRNAQSQKAATEKPMDFDVGEVADTTEATETAEVAVSR